MYQAPVKLRPPRAALRTLPPGTVYLGEDARYYYFAHPGANPTLGGFFDNVGHMFTRMVKITPQSFTLNNIYKGFINTTVAVASGGISLALPAKLQREIQGVARYAVPVIAAGALGAAFAPSIMSMLAPKLLGASKILGGGGAPGAPGSPVYGPTAPPPDSSAPSAASTIGANLFAFLAKLPPAQQAQLAQQITPQQIAQMEQSGQLPANLLPLFQQTANAAYNPPVDSAGSAALYNALPAPAPAPVHAGMVGGLDNTTLLLIGVPAAFFLLQTLMGKK